MTVNVYKWNGASWSQIVTAGSATEVGDGYYSYQLASGSNTAEGLYLFVFVTTGTADLKKVGAGWAVQKAGIENLDSTISGVAAAVWAVLTSAIATVGSIGKLLVTDIDAAISSRAAAGVTVTVSSPVVSDQSLAIVHGDDYFAADSSSIDFTLSGLPTLIGGSCKLSFHKRTDPAATVTSFAGSILSATQVRFELSAANTASLAIGEYDYDVQVTLANGHIRTPVRGFASLLQDVSA